MWILIYGNPSFVPTQYSCEVRLWWQSIPTFIVCQGILAFCKLDTFSEQFLVWIINIDVVWHRKFSFMFHNFLLARESALRPSRCLVISEDLLWLQACENLWTILEFVLILRYVVLLFVNSLSCLVKLCESALYCCWMWIPCAAWCLHSLSDLSSA